MIKAKKERKQIRSKFLHFFSLAVFCRRMQRGANGQPTQISFGWLAGWLLLVVCLLRLDWRRRCCRQAVHVSEPKVRGRWSVAVSQSLCDTLLKSKDGSLHPSESGCNIGSSPESDRWWALSFLLIFMVYLFVPRSLNSVLSLARVS